MPRRTFSFPARRWEPPADPPRRGVLIAVVVAAAIAAGTVRLDRPGLGWLITSLAVVAVGVVAAWARRSGSVTLPVRGATGHVREVVSAAWALGAVALLGVGTVRAAGWLFVLCVPVAMLCYLQALTGGRSARAMFAGTAAGPVAAIRALPWAARGVRGATPSAQAPARLLASVTVTVVLLVVFGALFASADPAFGKLLSRVVPDLEATSVARSILLFGTVGLGAVAAAYLIYAPPELAEPGEPSRPLRRLEWVLPVALLDALFTTFVLVQLTVLFGGDQHVLRTADLTYANYARGGFWQLLVVTALTLIVIGVVARKAPRAARSDRVAIRLLLGALALLTLVIVASALKRLAIYEEAYGYTRLRLLVGAIELWLGFVFVLLLVAGVALRARWLPRAVLASAVLGLLGLAVLNPDRFIAGQNVDRFERTNRVDLWYLSQLSADAALELDRLPPTKRGCAMNKITSELGKRDSWYTYNVGRSMARSVSRNQQPCSP